MPGSRCGRPAVSAPGAVGRRAGGGRQAHRRGTHPPPPHSCRGSQAQGTAPRPPPAADLRGRTGSRGRTGQRGAHARPTAHPAAFPYHGQRPAVAAAATSAAGGDGRDGRQPRVGGGEASPFLFTPPPTTQARRNRAGTEFIGALTGAPLAKSQGGQGREGGRRRHPTSSVADFGIEIRGRPAHNAERLGKPRVSHAARSASCAPRPRTPPTNGGTLHRPARSCSPQRADCMYRTVRTNHLRCTQKVVVYDLSHTNWYPDAWRDAYEC